MEHLIPIEEVTPEEVWVGFLNACHLWHAEMTESAVINGSGIWTSLPAYTGLHGWKPLLDQRITMRVERG